MRYIGSKKLLLQHIKNMLDKHTNGTEETFLDLFAGTNTVGLFFKPYYTFIVMICFILVISMQRF